MDFIDILQKLKGEHVILGLIDLEDISGQIRSIERNEEIITKSDNIFEKTPIDFVKYVIIPNPESW